LRRKRPRTPARTRTSSNVPRFFVAGLPQPGGSKKGFPVRRKTGKMGVAIVDANPKVKAWQAVVKAAARKVVARRDAGPVQLILDFHLPRGKTVTRDQHTVKPDALKLARAVEDALTGIAYTDDAQVVCGSQSKQYAVTESEVGVWITVL